MFEHHWEGEAPAEPLRPKISHWEKQPGRDAALADGLIHLASCARARGDLIVARGHAERASLLAHSVGAVRLAERADRERALAAVSAAGRSR